jgi:Tfp pilus assembly protein PilV
MVALVVLAVGVLATTQVSLAVAVMMQQSTAKTELVALADNRLESVAGRRYADLVPAVEVDTVLVRGTAYVRTTRITAPNARTRHIRVDLGSSRADALRYSAETYVSSP